MVNDFRKRGDKATIPGTEIYFFFSVGKTVIFNLNTTFKYKWVYKQTLKTQKKQ